MHFAFYFVAMVVYFLQGNSTTIWGPELWIFVLMLVVWICIGMWIYSVDPLNINFKQKWDAILEQELPSHSGRIRKHICGCHVLYIAWGRSASDLRRPLGHSNFPKGEITLDLGGCDSFWICFDVSTIHLHPCWEDNIGLVMFMNSELFRTILDR